MQGWTQERWRERKSPPRPNGKFTFGEILLYSKAGSISDQNLRLRKTDVRKIASFRATERRDKKIIQDVSPMVLCHANRCKCTARHFRQIGIVFAITIEYLRTRSKRSDF